MKNLLMIIPFFPPMAGGGVYRPLGFVKYLEQYGWRVTVIAPNPSAFWITDETLLEEIPSSCDIYRTATLSGQYVLSLVWGSRGNSGAPQVRSSRRFQRIRKLSAFALVPDTYLGWYPFAVHEGRRILRTKPIDAIYSTSPPETSHLIGAKLSAFSGKPWVADFRDPWMNLYLMPPPTRLHERLHQALEKRVCTRASVVVTTRWHEALLAKKYPTAGNVRIIPNGYDHEKLDAFSNLAPPDDRFRILHAGMLTQKRSAVPFLKGLKIYLDRSPESRRRFEVRFVGPREDESEIESARLALDDIVEFPDTVSHVETLKMERTSHILLLVKHRNPVYHGMVPGKLYEYVGAARPILALAPEGEVKDIVNGLGRGEVAPLDSPEQIADRIGEMYDRFLSGTLDRDYNLAPVDEFRRDRQAGELAGHLDSLLR
jgi:glycosyltransferase involved in cell wall biosynthesis